MTRNLTTHDLPSGGLGHLGVDRARQVAPVAIKINLYNALEADGLVHGLDFHTAAKAAFIADLVEIVFRPRGLDYKITAACARHADAGCAGRGKGLLRGVRFADKTVARRVSAASFELGLLVETSGADGEVLKLVPPLTIEVEALRDGLAIVERAIRQVLHK